MQKFQITGCLSTPSFTTSEYFFLPLCETRATSMLLILARKNLEVPAIDIVKELQSIQLTTSNSWYSPEVPSYFERCSKS